MHFFTVVDNITLHFVNWKNQVKVLAGRSVTLTCEIQESETIRSEDCRYSWRRDNKGVVTDVPLWTLYPSNPLVFTLLQARGVLLLYILRAEAATVGRYICSCQYKYGNSIHVQHREVQIALGIL